MADQLLQLDPSKVQIGDNIRFGVKAHSLEGMMNSIVQQGGVITPVIVAPLPKGAANGFTHRLLVGFTRHAAVLKLNKDAKAGLTLPATVRPMVDGVELMKLQITENHERENLSPIDQALAAKRLLDAGVTIPEVLAIFSRPGGRKGLTMQPASPAWLRQSLKMLELPKPIQDKIHLGLVSGKASWELLRVPADKREAILEAAENARQADMDREEREDQREAKVAETEGAKVAKLKAAEEAKVVAETAKAAAIEAHNVCTKEMEALRVKVHTRFGEMINLIESTAKGGDKDKLLKVKEDVDQEKKVLGEKVAAAKVTLREAEKAVSKTTVDEDKASRAYKALTSPAPKAQAEPKEPKAAAAPKPVSEKQVRTAAKEAGVAKVAPLKLPEVAEVVRYLSTSKVKKVAAIGAVLVEVLAGKLSPKEAEKLLGK